MSTNLFSTEEGRKKVLSRFSCFNGVGNDLRGITDYQEALKLANLDYEVEKKPLIYEDGGIAENAYGIRILGTNQHLGMVGKDYTPVTNTDAFLAAQELVETGNMVFETGGISKGSKNALDYAKTFMVLRGEDIEIGNDGDTFNSFIVFRNSFDGSSGVQYRFLLQRLVCLNGMVRYLGGKKSQFWINIQHSSTVIDKIRIANEALYQRAKEIKQIQAEATAFMNTPLTATEFKTEIVPQLLKVMKLKTDDKDEQKRQRGEERVAIAVQKALSAYDAEDTQNYNNTAYKVLLAMSDFESHISPFRNTDNPQLYFNRLLEGMIWTTGIAKYIAETRGIKVKSIE